MAEEQEHLRYFSDPKNLERLNKMYEQGDLTKGEYSQDVSIFFDERMRLYVKELSKGGAGRVAAGLLVDTVAKINTNWEKIKSAAAGMKKNLAEGKGALIQPKGPRTPAGQEYEATKEAKDILIASLGLLGIQDIPGEFSGAQVENYLRDIGVSPGLAKVGNAIMQGVWWVLPGKMAATATTKIAQTSAARTITHALKTGNVDHSIRVVDEKKLKELLDFAAKAEGMPKGLDEVGDALFKLKQPRYSDPTWRPTLQESLDMWNDLERHKIDEHLEVLKRTYKISTEEILERLKSRDPNSALSNDEAVRALMLSVTARDDMLKTALDLATSRSDEALTAMKRDFGGYATYMTETVNSQTAGARTTEILRLASTESETLRQVGEAVRHHYPQLTKSGNDKEAWINLAQDLIRLEVTKGSNAVEKLILTTTQPGRWRQFGDIYRNILLARPMTHLVNAISNTMSGPLAAGDILLGANKIDDVVDAVNFSKGLALGHLSLLSKQHFGVSLDPDFIVAGLNKAEVAAREAGKGTPAWLLIKSDELTQWQLQTAFVYMHAAREARDVVSKGALRPGEVDNFITRFMDTPPKYVIDEAGEFSQRYTNNDPLWFLGEGTRRVLQWGPGILYNPFLRTPMNLLKTGVSLTPGLNSLSFTLWNDLQKGGDIARRAQGRITQSWMLGQFLWEYAKSGRITGHGPVDQETRDRWMAAGFEPYSIWDDGAKAWRSYKRFDPVAIPIGLAVDLAHASTNTDWSDTGEASRAFSTAGLLFVKGVADSTWMQNLNSFGGMVSDIMAGKFDAGSAVSTAITPIFNLIGGGPLLTAQRDELDREVKDKDSNSAYYQVYYETLSKLPMFSKMVPPKLTAGGDVLFKASPVIPGSPGWIHPDFWQPVQTRQKSINPIDLEAWRVKAQMRDFPRSIGIKSGASPDSLNDIKTAREVALEPWQHYEWKNLSLNQLRIRHTPINGGEEREMNYREVMTDLIQSPYYQNLNTTPKLQAQEMETVYNEFMKLGASYFLVNDAKRADTEGYKSIFDRSRENMLGTLGEIPPEYRPHMEQILKELNPGTMIGEK